MKVHQFRLTTLLRLREAVRDERRQQLAEVLRAADAIAARQNAIDSELAELKQRHAAPRGAFDVRRLVDADRYESVLRDEWRQLDQRKIVLGMEIESRREAPLAADRDVRALEQLRDAHDRRQLADDERRSSKELDEVALRRHGVVAL